MVYSENRLASKVLSWSSRSGGREPLVAAGESEGLAWPQNLNPLRISSAAGTRRAWPGRAKALRSQVMSVASVAREPSQLLAGRNLWSQARQQESEPLQA